MSEQPRAKLAIVYDSASITPLELVEAARPVCDLIWVAELADPLLGPLYPLLRRLGTVIDSSGLSQPEVLGALAENPPQGVMTFAERQLPVAAAIAAAHQLAFFSPATAQLLSNKYRQRVALAEAGLPGPTFWPVFAGTERAERIRLAAEISYPVVVKPQEGRGSRQTSLVTDAAALVALLDELEGDDMLVEEQLIEAPRTDARFGQTLMVDTLSDEGRRLHYAVCGHFVPAPPFRGAGSFTPSHFDDEQVGAILEATDAALAALGIGSGFTDTDVMLTSAGPRVMEVNGRIGGEVHTLVELAGGAPLLREAMRFAVGGAGVEVEPVRRGQVAFCANYQAPMDARRLVAVEGLDAVATLPGVTRVMPFRHPGDSVDWREGTMSRIFTMYGVAADHDELAETHAQMERVVSATYE